MLGRLRCSGRHVRRGVGFQYPRHRTPKEQPFRLRIVLKEEPDLKEYLVMEAVEALR